MRNSTAMYDPSTYQVASCRVSQVAHNACQHLPATAHSWCMLSVRQTPLCQPAHALGHEEASVDMTCIAAWCHNASHPSPRVLGHAHSFTLIIDAPRLQIVGGRAMDRHHPRGLKQSCPAETRPVASNKKGTLRHSTWQQQQRVSMLMLMRGRSIVTGMGNTDGTTAAQQAACPNYNCWAVHGWCASLSCRCLLCKLLHSQQACPQRAVWTAPLHHLVFAAGIQASLPAAGMYTGILWINTAVTTC